MTAYLSLAARPILFPTDSANLRTQVSGPLKTGMLAVFSDAALVRRIVQYDAASTATDDGTATPVAWKPSDLAGSDPGRWIPFGGEDAASHTYVKRDAAGAIPGVTFAGDIAQEVVHVNWDTGANDPVPSAVCGLSVDRGAIAGVERDRPGVWYDEGKPDQWILGADTAGNDVPVTALYLRAAGLRAATAPTGTSFIQSATGQGWEATLDTVDYFLVRGLTGPEAKFGDELLATTSLESSTQTTMRSRLGPVDVHAATGFSVKDSGGVSTFFAVDISGTATSSFYETRAVRDTDATTPLIGLSIQPLQEASAGQTIRWSPTLDIKAKARVGVSNRTVTWRAYQVPTTGGQTSLKIERDLGAGAGFAFFAELTTSTPTQAKVGLLIDRIALRGSGGEIFWELDNSSIGLGASSQIVMIGRNASAPMEFKGAATAANTEVIRFWASGETKIDLEKVFSFGHGTSYAETGFLTGDCVFEAPDLHLDATVQSGAFNAVLMSHHMIDLSGGASVPAIPAASAANTGRRIRFSQTVDGANTITITPASGTIEGQATFVVTGVAAISSTVPGVSVTIASMGVGAGSPGWKVVSSV